ncbi:Protein of unknown function [Granulicella rosea]|uniref:DUF2442 domain-containing protein n=1 Tax=Granulicella rosea TaxID=474952 RepID=A0A239L2H1_9BACT|nr:DUF2442 domain-containing protein [Granulicella rosea]SNT24807.1 Protein of unknown function [Granulicella rosea]
MAEHLVVTTEAEFETALEKARIHDNDPVAQSVSYVSGLNLLIVGLSNGRRLALPLEDLQGLTGATAKQMENHELLGQGTGISFPALDVDLYVPALIDGVYGNRSWMANLGKKGGTGRTSTAPAASHKNGYKDGRRKKAASVGPKEL